MSYCPMLIAVDLSMVVSDLLFIDSEHEINPCCVHNLLK